MRQSGLFGYFRLRALGPVAAVSGAEAARAGMGAAIGLAVAACVAILISPDQGLAIYLIAPFGASSVLLFAAPNSPLAQPWPAIVGNTVSALVAIAVCHLVPYPLVAIPLAVGLAIVAMAMVQATHPPGGAVAMTVVLGAERILPMGPGFALVPVAAGTLLLVTVAVAYAHLTGRRYPFRQFGEVNPHGTHDPVPAERIGLSEAELVEILSRYRQSLNLGVEDLARLIAAAEIQAASHLTGPETAADIMSRDLVTVSPDTPIHEVASLFDRHGFTSLPVVGEDDRMLGVIFQLHLISEIFRRSGGEGTGFAGLVRRLQRGKNGNFARAADIMEIAPASATPATPIAALLPQLATNGMDAVPILDGPRIVGVVTQTDLIAALARQSLHGRPDAS